MIEAPYLLYLGEATDPLSAKTARGIGHWRPQLVLGQMRGGPATVSLGLPELSFAEAVVRGARTLVIGVANAGGVMSARMVDDVVAALEAGLHVASGLHQRLAARPRIASAAAAHGRRLWDVREPPADLPVGTGARRAGKRLLTVGTDCAVGKMYTALSLERELRGRALAADFRATGQTGILIAGKGMPVDAVIADFISGSVERLSPARDDAGWDLIEGQGSLFHPGFAGVSLGLLHGAQPAALVLCHEAGRRRMRHAPDFPVPDLARCLERNLEAARLTNPDAVAVGVALNTSALDRETDVPGCRGRTGPAVPGSDGRGRGADRRPVAGRGCPLTGVRRRPAAVPTRVRPVRRADHGSPADVMAASALLPRHPAMLHASRQGGALWQPGRPRLRRSACSPVFRYRRL